VPDYLQDIIDRSQAYQDPATYPIDANVPAPWEDQTPKKKRGQQQTSVFPGGVGSGDDTPAPDQGPPMVFIPGTGYVPRTPPSPLPALTQQAGLLPGGGLPSATPVFPSGVPTPQARPSEAPYGRSTGSLLRGLRRTSSPPHSRLPKRLTSWGLREVHI